jgi:mono/diheme cytochrome c family protein
MTLTQRGWRTLLLASALCFFLCSCSSNPGDDDSYSGYPYPVRTDVIVVRNPTELPTTRLDPSTFDDFLRKFPSLGGDVLDPANLMESQQKAITATLDRYFGTPTAPKVLDITEEQASRLNLQSTTLQGTVRRYKQSCVQCHGATGNGRGPTGMFSEPMPRDFRLGKFKLVTGAGHATGRPRMEDLKRVMKLGLPGVPGMGPSGLSDAENSALASYVVFLSLRGEVEATLLREVLDVEGNPNPDYDALAKQTLQKALQAWAKADEPNPWTITTTERPDEVTPEYTESIRRGAALFGSAKTGCVTCHENYGSTPTYRYNVWGIPYRVRDLTGRDRHFVRDGLDAARLFKFGLHSANMPAQPELSEQELKDLVNFTRELPYPARLPAELRLQNGK